MVTSTHLAAAMPSVDLSLVVIAAPGAGDGFWAGGPSAVYTDDGYYLAYRLRRPVGEGRGYANVVARSDDGVEFETVVTLLSEDYGCDSLERPALVRRPDGGWRVYLSLATRGTKHWSVIALDSDDVAGLGSATPQVVWPGDLSTEALKDPVVMHAGGQWHAWVCSHPLTEVGQEDRMTTRYATSADGLQWDWQSLALAPRPGQWDSRGARMAAVIPGASGLGSPDDLAFYDGRASAAENWYERTGLARSVGADRFAAAASEPFAQSPFGQHTLRYASTVPLPGGGLRIYFEASNAGGGNDLRTQLLDLDDLRALLA